MPSGLLLGMINCDGVRFPALERFWPGREAQHGKIEKGEDTMGDHTRLSLPLRFCCAITSADPEILSQCNNIDKSRIARHAVALLCTFTMAAVLWSAVFSAMLPLQAAIAGGLFAGLIIYLLDLAIATSDWELKGVLRDRAPFSLESVRSSVVRIVKFGFRIALTLTLAIVTGTYVTLWWFNDTIENFIHQQRLTLNEPIEAEYRAEREKLQGQLIDPLHQDLAIALEQRKSSQTLLDDSQTKLLRFEESVSSTRLEMHREETGLGGRLKGRGPKYDDAKIRLEEAKRHADMARGEVEHARAHLQEIDTRIKAINVRLLKASGVLETRTALLTAERDARLMPERSDFLMEFKALEELKSDPVYGASMTLVARLTKLTIMIFEAIFIIILLNDHASLYTLRLLCKTRLEAQKIDAEYVRERAKIETPEVATNGPLTEAAIGVPRDSIPEHDEPRAMPVATSGPSNGNHGSDERNSFDQPIFDTPEKPAEAESNHGEAASADSETEAVLYPVVGGKPGEQIATAEALADGKRYWVNPESPDEIWDREYYEALQGEDYNNDAA